MKVKVIATGDIKEIASCEDFAYYLKGFFSKYAHIELLPYFEEPTITLTDEELLAECERRGVSTKITK